MQSADETARRSLKHVAIQTTSLFEAVFLFPIFQLHKISHLPFRATILVVRRKGAISMEQQNQKDAELRDFAIFNFSAQQSLQDDVTAEVAGDMKTYLETTASTLEQTMLHFRTFIHARIDQQHAIDRLYQDTMEAFQEYQASLRPSEEQEREVPIMAEEITKTEPVQEAEKTEEKKLTPAAELRAELTKQFQELFAEKKAFWQRKDIEQHRPYNPTYSNRSDGYDSLNAAILMQAQAERGGKDARWMSASELKNSSKVSLKDPSIQPTKIIEHSFKYNKDYIIPMYNYADLNGVSPKDNYCKSDAWAKTFTDKIGFNKDSNIVRVAITTSDSIKKADKKFEEAEKANAKAGRDADRAAYHAACEPLHAEATARSSALKSYDVAANEEKFAKMSSEEKLFHDMAKNLQADPHDRDYVVKAAKDALLRGDKEDAVKKAIKKFAPQSAYDGPRKEILKNDPYPKYIIKEVNKQYKNELKNAKAAQR